MRSAAIHHFATKLRKKLRLGHSLAELDPNLSAQDLLFRAPPLTEELVSAIRRISPQYHLRTDEASRRFWELNQNGACWGEYLALKPYLDRLGPPRRVLDIGPGLGRSAVFFGQLDGWISTRFDLYESDGRETRYTQAGPRFEDSFCGDVQALRQVLSFNQISNVSIHDAADLDFRLSGLPGPFDFIYSFFAIGFHWSIEHFLDEIFDLMSDRSLAAFTLHNRFSNLAAIERVPHRVVTAAQSWPRGRSSRLLVISKSPQLVAGL